MKGSQLPIYINDLNKFFQRFLPMYISGIGFPGLALTFFLSMASMTACTINNSKDKLSLLQGSWMGCDSNGNYVELHFKGLTFTNCMDVFISGADFTYQVSKDSMHFYSRTDGELISWNIGFKSEDHLILSNADYGINLKRISGEYAFPYDAYTKQHSNDPIAEQKRDLYEFVFNQRNAGHQCGDLVRKTDTTNTNEIKKYNN